MTAPYADLIERLRDPHFQGAMQYLRGWTDLDDMHDDAAKAIEALQAEVERLSAAPPASVGWQDIGTIPEKTRVLVWVTGRQLSGVRFGSAYRLSDGRLFAKPEGVNGDWSKDVTHWMPLPPLPRSGEG